MFTCIYNVYTARVWPPLKRLNAIYQAVVSHRIPAELRDDPRILIPQYEIKSQFQGCRSSDSVMAKHESGAIGAGYKCADCPTDPLRSQRTA